MTGPGRGSLRDERVPALHDRLCHVPWLSAAVQAACRAPQWSGVQRVVLELIGGGHYSQLEGPGMRLFSLLG